MLQDKNNNVMVKCSIQIKKKKVFLVTDKISLKHKSVCSELSTIIVLTTYDIAKYTCLGWVVTSKINLPSWTKIGRVEAYKFPVFHTCGPELENKTMNASSPYPISANG